MVDIPTSPSVQAATTVAATQPQPVTPVDTTVVSVPDKIEQLLRQIQVNATVSDVQNNGMLVLNSALGQLALQLPKLADAEQQNLVQQLNNLALTQKQVSITVQPGSPPTQAVLFVPPAPQIAQQVTQPSQNKTPIQPPANNIAAPPVSVGQTLSAVTLPPPNIPSPNVPLNNLGTNNSPLVTFAELPDITFSTPQPQQSAATPTPLPTLPNATTSLASETSFLNPTPIPEPPNLATPLPSLPSSLPQPINLTTPLPQMPTSSDASLAPSLSLPQDSNNVVSNLTPTQSAPQPLAQSTPIASPLSLLQVSGNDVSLTIDAILPPASANNTAPVAAAPTQPNQILATVINSGPNSPVLLQTTDATFYVKQPTDIAVGSKLLLTVDAAPALQAQTLALPTATNAPDPANLQNALSTVAQINPQVAQQITANHIPQTNVANALPGAFLFIMGAFKQSSVRTWLGDDAVDALTRAGKLDLLGKLAGDLSKAGDTVRDPTIGEWKSYPVPVQQQNNTFQLVNFYVHQNYNQRGDNTNDAAAPSSRPRHTRFVVDVQMSQLGAMQLDGFIQPKKLDIIVRSERLLPNGLHDDLRQAYTNALMGIDYAGSLNFQVGRNNWLVIQNAKQQSPMMA